MITQVLGAGDFFGYFQLLKETAYTDTAVAMEDLALRLIPASDFTMLLFNNRDFAAQFIKMIANKADQTEQQLIELAYSSVRRKVANALMAHRDEKNQIKVGRDDLAATAGTAKETFIRTLSDFKSENIIAVEGQLIRIIDESKLASMPQ